MKWAPFSAVIDIPKAESKPAPRILILGVGNLLLSDEGLGVHVIKALQERYEFPANVECYDGGTGGLGLLSLLKGKDYLFIIDALLIGEPPGTGAMFKYEAIPKNYRRKDAAHGIDALDLLAVAQITDHLPDTTVLGLQSGDIITPGLELTPPVAAGMDRLIDQLLGLLSGLNVPVQLRRDAPPTATTIF